MTGIPQAIINYNNKFQGQYATIVALLNAIGINPPTPQQKKDLLIEMNALLGAMNAQKAPLVAANASLIQFNTNLSADHIALTTGAASVTDAIAFDKGDVVAMQNKIGALQLSITSLNKMVMWSAIGIGAGVFIAIVGVVVAFTTFGAGVVVAVVGVAGALASVGALIAAEVEIQHAADGIAAAQAEMSTDNHQIVVLNSVASTMTMLMTKNKAAMDAMSTVLTDWATLTGKLQGVIDDLNAAEGDIGSILDLGDMATTQAAWQQLGAFAQNMQNGLGNITAVPQVVAIQAA